MDARKTSFLSGHRPPQEPTGTQPIVVEDQTIATSVLRYRIIDREGKGDGRIGAEFILYILFVSILEGMTSSYTASWNLQSNSHFNAYEPRAQLHGARSCTRPVLQDSTRLAAAVKR